MACFTPFAPLKFRRFWRSLTAYGNEMLNHIDLFTGVGGFTLALEGISKPLMYCDNDPHVLNALDCLMERGALPRAKVVTDVRDLAAIKKAVGNSNIDIVTMGWPCLGLSSIGANEGLRHEQTKLFYDAFKVIATFKPTIALFENVAGLVSIMHRKDLRIIVRMITRLGYDMRWTCSSAADVGAPHLRRRWFCLCTRKRRPIPSFLNSSTARCLNTKWTNPPKLMEYRSKMPNYAARVGQMGNSIVPLACRLAIFRMFTGFDGRIMSVDDLRANAGKRFEFVKAKDIAGDPAAWRDDIRHCVVIDTRKVIYMKVDRADHLDYGIELCPAHYKHKRFSTRDRLYKKDQSPLVTSKIYKELWPTPRGLGIGASHLMTVRTANDLGTAARYACIVNGRRQDKTDNSKWLSVRYAEWMMGFERDWTATSKCD